MIKKISVFLCVLIVFSFGVESKTVMAESSDNTAHFTLNISSDRAEITILESDCSVLIENGVCYIDGNVIYEEENNDPANDADKVLLEELSEWKENHPVNALDFSDNVTDIITQFMPYNIYSVSFGKNLKSIGDNVFSSSRIEKLDLPSSLTYIGKGAFEGCKDLHSIILPENLEILKEGAFHACSSLTDITVLSKNLILEENCFGFSHMETPLEGMIVRGYKGSTAEAYANENGFTFVSLDEPATTTTQTSQIANTTTTVITAVDSSTSINTSTEELTTTDTQTTAVQTTTAVGTTMPTSATGAESIVTTEISTVPTTVTTHAVITTETGTKLPQTGYSIWYQSLVAVAMGMVSIGLAVIVRSGVFRKKDSNS